MNMKSKEKMGQVTTAAKAERISPILHDGEGRLNGKTHCAQASFTTSNSRYQLRPSASGF
jgi:hypothetical protein